MLLKEALIGGVRTFLCMWRKRMVLLVCAVVEVDH